jgi:hypothetical protein
MPTPPMINEQLNALVKHFTKGSAAAFARSIHVTQQSFDRLLKPNKKSGKYPMVKPELVEAISTHYPGINMSWLHLGIGQMLTTIEDPPSPFIPSPQSGVPYYAVDFIHEFESIRNEKTDNIGYYIDFKAFNHADFWCNITGRSMEPEIVAGDFVAMKEIYNTEEGILLGEMYGIVTQNFCIVRRVAKGSSDQHLRLIPSNKSGEYTDKEIPYSAIERLFLIICCAKNM